MYKLKSGCRHEIFDVLSAFTMLSNDTSHTAVTPRYTIQILHLLRRIRTLIASSVLADVPFALCFRFLSVRKTLTTRHRTLLSRPRRSVRMRKNVHANVVPITEKGVI